MISMSPKDRTMAIAILITGVFGIGFSPALVKALGIQQLGPSAIGFWRNFIGAFFLFSVAFFQKKSLRLSLISMKWAVLAGLFFALDLNFWHRSVMYAGSGISTIIGNTQVFITTILSIFIFKEKISIRFVLSAVAAIFGVVLLAGILDSEVIFTPLYKKGITYSVVTAVMYALYIISMKKSGTDSSLPSPVVFMGWISLFSGVFLLAGSFFDHGVFFPSNIQSVLLVILLGVVVQGVCWWLIASTMVKIPTHHTSLILLLQPAMAMIWGYLFFSEYLTAQQIAGVFVTLGAVYIGSVKKK